VADCETNYRLLVGLLLFLPTMCLACDFGVCIMRRETGAIKGVGLVLAFCFWLCHSVWHRFSITDDSMRQH
jgi:hypothetical protein